MASEGQERRHGDRRRGERRRGRPRVRPGEPSLSLRVTLPWSIYWQLAERSHAEGRPMAQLARVLLAEALRANTRSE